MAHLSYSDEDITDLSDFKNTHIPALAELDVLERCYICKEFFNAPVITSCNHTFCSQCIREYLITNNLCPLCKTEVFESNLKKDLLLEEIVRCYAKLRPRLLEYLKVEKDQDTNNSNSNSDSKEIGNGSSNESSTVLPTEDSDVIVTKELLRETRSSYKYETIEPERKKQKVDDKNQESKLELNDGLVECPICSRRMTAEKLQRTHIDACLNSGGLPFRLPSPEPSKRPKSSISSFFQAATAGATASTSSPSPSPSPVPVAQSSSSLSKFGEKDASQKYGLRDPPKLEHSRKPNSKEPKRLQKLDFSSLSTVKLKEKLSQLHIPMSGTRNQLELRYNQYFVLYNSNLDSNHPVSDRVLRQKLHKWELAHLGFSKKSGSSGFGNGSISSRSITEKNFLVSEWMQEYKLEFKTLVKQARKSFRESKAKVSQAEKLNNGSSKGLEDVDGTILVVNEEEKEKKGEKEKEEEEEEVSHSNKVELEKEENNYNKESKKEFCPSQEAQEPLSDTANTSFTFGSSILFDSEP